MTAAALVAICVLLRLSSSKLLRNVPENGVGKLLLSTDDDHEHYNPSRLMVMFNLDCLGGSHSSDLVSKNQQLKINSIISNHYPCLSHHRNENFQQFESGFGVSFLNIDTQDCIDTTDSKTATTAATTDSSIVSDGFTAADGLGSDDVQLDYNEHCIHLFAYEPVFKLNFGENYQKFASGEYTCNEQSTSGLPPTNTYAWSLDQADRYTANNLYRHPDIDSDNGVDLYIVDSGVLGAHDEFAGSTVIHMLGDGPAYYAQQDYYGSHGTHVAGTAGGGSFGVSKNLKIFDYRVCDYPDYYTPSQEGDYPCYTSLIYTALNNISLELAANDRRGVINLSLGGRRSFWSNMYEAYFGSIRDNGGIVVVAAGNDDDDACDYSPAWTTSAITVGAANYTYQKAYFSNWGDCVDIWAPGQDITSGIADCTDCYSSYQGTSMASPHITGLIANLLWVDPTLTYYEIKTLLKRNTTIISGDMCNTFECLYPFYDCDTIPSQWYNNWPPAATQLASNVDGSISNFLPNYDCNVVAEAVMDPLNDNAISYVEYYPADKCVSMREDTNSWFSYSYECVSDDTVEFTVWDNKNCSGVGDGALTIENGWIDEEFWYYVDCSDDSEREEESIARYDSSDCDLVYRQWYPTQVGRPDDGNDYVCLYQETDDMYRDTAVVVGACEYFVNHTTGYNYSLMFTCTNNAYYITYYLDTTECDENATQQVQTFEEGCYYNPNTTTAYELDILECGNATIEVFESSKSSQEEEKSGGSQLLMFVMIIGAGSGLFLALCVVVIVKVMTKKGKSIAISAPNLETLRQKSHAGVKSHSQHLASSGTAGESHKVVAAPDDDDIRPPEGMPPPPVPMQTNQPPPLPTHYKPPGTTSSPGMPPPVPRPAVPVVPGASGRARPPPPRPIR